jgi:hypothetical protein
MNQLGGFFVMPSEIQLLFLVKNLAALQPHSHTAAQPKGRTAAWPHSPKAAPHVMGFGQVEPGWCLFGEKAIVSV